jgi:hypothetical protein
MGLHKKSALCAATQCFEGKGAGSREKVENFAALQRAQSTGQDAEESFPHPICCRSDLCASEFDQFLAACPAANNSQ